MLRSQDSYIAYLEEEIKHTKASLLKTNKSYIINSILPEITLLEQALTRLKNIPQPPKSFKEINRQEAPTGNTPPRPSSDILSSSASPVPVPLDPIVVPDRVFTLQELQSSYNGLGNNPSYVALYGLVFDVSNIATWGGGTHFGMIAGTDATPGARACGFHNPGLIMRIMPAVGRLAPPAAGEAGTVNITITGSTNAANITGNMGGTFSTSTGENASITGSIGVTGNVNRMEVNNNVYPH